MPSKFQVWVARGMWFAPLLMLFLVFNQYDVAQDLRATLEAGEAAVADIVEYEVSDRADMPFGYVSLKVNMEDGSSFDQEKMALPYTLLPILKGKEQVDVRVDRTADQPVVITQIAQTQWKIAAIQSAVSLGAFLILGFGVFWWNRHLSRQRDPAMAGGRN